MRGRAVEDNATEEIGGQVIWGLKSLWNVLRQELKFYQDNYGYCLKSSLKQG